MLGSPPTLNGLPLANAGTVQLATPAGWLEGIFETTAKAGSRHRLHVPLPGGGELEILLPPEALLRWPPEEAAQEDGE